MAVYHWVKGIVGIWIAWIVLSILGLFIGWFYNFTFFIEDKLNQTGVPVPDPIHNSLVTIFGWFTSVWNFLALAVFTGFVIYILINSARRDVDEYYYYPE